MLTPRQCIILTTKQKQILQLIIPPRKSAKMTCHRSKAIDHPWVTQADMGDKAIPWSMAHQPEPNLDTSQQPPSSTPSREVPGNGF